MNIAVVVDSTAVMGERLLEAHSNLYSIPLKIIFKDNTYSDGIDLTQDDFFTLVEVSEDLPSTSQPSIGELENLFKKLLPDYDHILYITISSKISGTYESGMMARQLVSEEKITVFDSLFTSIIQKSMALKAVEMGSENKTIIEIVNELENMRENAGIILVVDDLTHLQRNGRMSKTSAVVGNFLKIKPVLELKDGKLELIKKVKTTKKAHKLLLDLIDEKGLKENSHIMVAEAQAEDYSLVLKEKLQNKYPENIVTIDDLSPVISVHTGPKTVGIGWIK